MNRIQRTGEATGPAVPVRIRATWPRIVPLSFACLVLCALLSAPAARAVLISTDDGTGNTTPPAEQPGFSNVGIIKGLSGVYVRNGWVLTTNHVGVGPIELGGIVYEPLADSKFRFQNPDGSLTDLIAFKLIDRPPLPDLVLSNAPMSMNTFITMIGNGRNRGAPTTWMGTDGWEWGAGRAMRWGTNVVSRADVTVLGTRSFRTNFDDIPSPVTGEHEADIINGDSGGAAFVGSGIDAELAGILFARAVPENQPADTSLYGNDGITIDLFAYRDEILEVIDTPDCGDGLDDDLDGLVDLADPGCKDLNDPDEREEGVACDNGLDDDGDSLFDYPDDPGCADPGDPDERGAIFQCDNGLDDDGDLLIDYPDDDGCLHPTGLIEAPEPAGSLMISSGVLALLAFRRRRTRPAPSPPREMHCADRRGSRGC